MYDNLSYSCKNVNIDFLQNIKLNVFHINNEKNFVKQFI